MGDRVELRPVAVADPDAIPLIRVLILILILVPSSCGINCCCCCCSVIRLLPAFPALRDFSFFSAFSCLLYLLLITSILTRERERDARSCVCVLVSLVFRALCKFLEIEPFVAFPSCACPPAVVLSSCGESVGIWGVLGSWGRGECVCQCASRAPAECTS